MVALYRQCCLHNFTTFIFLCMHWCPVLTIVHAGFVRKLFLYFALQKCRSLTLRCSAAKMKRWGQGQRGSLLLPEEEKGRWRTVDQYR